MDDIFFSIAGATMALFFLAIAISWIKDSISDAFDRKVKRRKLKEEEFVKINEENLSLRAECKKKDDKIRELESTIKCLNQAEWKKQYYELQTLYYKMYLEYNQDPTAKSAEDLFPIEEKRLSAAQLHYALADEKARTQRLEESVSAHKQEIFEYKNEIQALEFEIDELLGTINESEDYKQQYDELKNSLPLSHLIDCPGIDAYSKAMDDAKGEKAMSGSIIVKDIYLINNAHSSSPPKFIYADVYSKTSNMTYKTSLIDCSCKNYQINAHKGKHYVCKHMLALALNMEILPFIKK